ncbi:MAG: DUF3800 domain-containing protein [bacterium]|nr:DUF3800 domain-containing protein [bacterium]
MRLREEFHAAALINHPGDLVRIKRNDRVTMIRDYADFLADLKDINLINIVIDKQGKPTNYDVFATAWKTLIQRFENTISHRNFAGPTDPDERGLILSDHTDDKKLTQLLRQMRRYNPVPHALQLGTGYRNLPLQYVIEDMSFRDSEHSYFIQTVDLAAFLLYQHLAPSAYLRKRAGHNYFNRIRSILCLHASSSDTDGLVRL